MPTPKAIYKIVVSASWLQRIFFQWTMVNCDNQIICSKRVKWDTSLEYI